MAQADAITHVARRLVAENPEHTVRGLARMLVAETNNALTFEQARKRIMGQLGLNGNRARKRMKNLGRAPKVPGQVMQMPPSIAEPWMPFTLNVTGRVGILSDLHVPYHNDTACRAAVDYLKSSPIAALVINGDLCDFYSISRYMKDPRQRDFSGELEDCRGFIAWLRSEFPKIPIVLKAGNHEERFQVYIWQHAPELSKDRLASLQAWLHLDKHNVTYVDDQRPIMLGKLPVMHGHELPKGMAAPVNVARGAFLRTLSTVLVGHSHRSSGHTESDMWHAETATWSTGCLCDLTPAFARVNKWNHGFAVATVYKDGQFDVENLRINQSGTVRTS